MRYDDAVKAFDTLRDILNEPFTVIVRDATIQRFEYTFEALWKFLKAWLKEREGIICNSPKACFREAFSLKLLTEEETVKFLEMTDDRNMTSHTYHEEISQILYARMLHYCKLIEVLLEKIELY